MPPTPLKFSTGKKRASENKLHNKDNLVLKKKFVESFARALKPLLGTKYISAPDVLTGEREMEWFVKAVGNLKAATGKPKKLGGLPHELGSTGFGVAHSARVAWEVISGKKIKNATIAVEGYGNVGSFTHKFLEEWGARVVAISDSRGMVYDEKGLKHSTALNIKTKTKTVANYPKVKKMPPEKIFSLKVDILIPASITDVINEKNKHSLKATIIVEGANIPMREAIEEDLFEQGIYVIPDFVANAGGVISSYAEHKGFSEKKAFELIEKKVSKSTHDVVKLSLTKKISPRTAALKLAQDKIRVAMRKRKNTF